MANLAIIPARGGSERIPRKNIKDFLGKPIITYSIEAALTSGLFDEVMVSTDDEEIAEISKAGGANVPFFRSAQNSDNFATTISVLKEVHDTYRTKIGKTFDYICCIYPTAPLIRIQHLKTGFETLTYNKLASVFPVIEFSYPIWRGLIINELGRSKLVWPEHLNSRSQDLEKVYHDAGQWYWYNPDLIEGSLFTENSGSIILLEQEVQDIDTLSDWILAELKFKFNR